MNEPGAPRDPQERRFHSSLASFWFFLGMAAVGLAAGVGLDEAGFWLAGLGIAGAILELLRRRAPHVVFRSWGLGIRTTWLRRRVDLAYRKIAFWTHSRKLLGFRTHDGRLHLVSLHPLSRCDRRRVLLLLESLPLTRKTRAGLSLHLQLRHNLPAMPAYALLVVLAAALGPTGMQAVGTQLVASFAPGAREVEEVGCRGATIWTPDQREVLVEVGKGDDVDVVRWYVEDPEAVMVNCFVDSGASAPPCEAVAEAYVEAASPTSEFIVQVMTNGGDEFFCRGYYDRSGKRVRGIE